jgi:hypothetical protein
MSIDGAIRDALAGAFTGVVGVSATLSRPSTAYDIATGDEGSGSEAWTLLLSPPDPVNVREIDGSRVLAGDARTFAVNVRLPDGWLPRAQVDTVAFSGSLGTWLVVGYRMVGIREVIGWELQLRR